MTQLSSPMETVDVRACETHDMVDQIKQELENLKNENKLAKYQINTLESKEKYHRVLFFLYLLIICAGVAKYSGSVSVNELHSILQDLTLKVQRVEEKLDEVKLQIQKEKETLWNNINEMREKQATGLGNMEKRMSEINKNVEKQNWGEFVWPINGWAAKMHSARTGGIQSILSDPFYSHKNGYKMRLSVWPDGYYAGKGTHLGVAFHLIQQEINNILTWPFKRPVTLSIINQHTGIDHSSFIVLYDNLPNNIIWNKPTTEIREGVGTNKLILLTELSSNTEVCQNDTIFIRCVVE